MTVDRARMPLAFDVAEWPPAGYYDDDAPLLFANAMRGADSFHALFAAFYYRLVFMLLSEILCGTVES